MNPAPVQMFSSSPLPINSDINALALENPQVIPVTTGAIGECAEFVHPVVHVGATVDGIPTGETGDDILASGIQCGTLVDLEDAGKVSRAIALRHAAEFEVIVVGGAAPIPLVGAAAIDAGPGILTRGRSRWISQVAGFNGRIGSSDSQPEHWRAGNSVVGADDILPLVDEAGRGGE